MLETLGSETERLKCSVMPFMVFHALQRNIDNESQTRWRIGDYGRREFFMFRKQGERCTIYLIAFRAVRRAEGVLGVSLVWELLFSAVLPLLTNSVKLKRQEEAQTSSRSDLGQGGHYKIPMEKALKPAVATATEV